MRVKDGAPGFVLLERNRRSFGFALRASLRMTLYEKTPYLCSIGLRSVKTFSATRALPLAVAWIPSDCMAPGTV